MEIRFWSIPRVLFELQRHTIRHFKGNLIIKNYFPYHKALWRKIKAPVLKKSVYFFLGHPLTTICVNVRDRIVCLSVRLRAISSRTAWGMETWMVPCCHKLSGACFKPFRFTKSCQKLSKKWKVDFTNFWRIQKSITSLYEKLQHERHIILSIF